jgi:ABC-2 type transport system ATP-binding protein
MKESAMSALIEIRNLTKSYGRSVVLQDIALDLPYGAIVGLMGPNGSGKTTLMKIITGMINDYSGEIRIDGEAVGAHTKAITAYLPDKNFLPLWMNCKQAVNYYADFFKDFDKPKAMDMLQKMQLTPRMKIKTMSKGMIEKLLLLLTMSRKARLFVLDEPLGGVDPSARAYIMETILANRTEGSTMLLSTHMIYDMEKVFDEALMIGRKQVLLHDSVKHIEESGRDLDALFREVFPYAG